MPTKAERAVIANKVLLLISQFGRHFFQHDERVSQFEISARGHIMLRDAYTGRLVYTHDRKSRWRGFTEGGTLRDLVCNLADYIGKDVPIRHRQFGPWPEYLCDGDLWGYGKEEMAKLREQLAPYVTFPEATDAGLR